MIKPIESMEHDDVMRSIMVKKCGSSLPNAEVIFLYRKYINPGEYICSSCPIEIVLLWRKYEIYFDKYMDKIGETIDTYGVKKVKKVKK